jgi:hypothetical protein
VRGSQRAVSPFFHDDVARRNERPNADDSRRFGHADRVDHLAALRNTGRAGSRRGVARETF